MKSKEHAPARVTIYAGLLYGINPLDQPAVELCKQLTLRYLSETGKPKP